VRQTKRNRCQIPEHRTQIKSLQRQHAYWMNVQSSQWARQDALRKENELLRLKLYQALHHIQNNGLELPETLRGIINPPADLPTEPYRPWWKRVFKI
jgi:hypothetical protein